MQSGAVATKELPIPQFLLAKVAVLKQHQEPQGITA